MFKPWKRLLALLAALAALFSLCGAASAAPEEGKAREPQELTAEDYAVADAIFASLPSTDGTRSTAGSELDREELLAWPESAEG